MLETKNIPQSINLETICCDLCGSANFKKWDFARLNTICKCNHCGLLFTNPRVQSIEEKDRFFYNTSYFKNSRIDRANIKAREKSYQIEKQHLERIIPGGAILDVGCGTGDFLSSLGSNWEKYGCDISTFAHKHASQKGLNIYQGEFEQLYFNKKKFDVIYFRASLHHTFSPRSSLEKAYKLTNKKGVLAICMSNNCSSLNGLLFKGHIKSYEQAHNYLFSRQTLSKYIENAGFEIVSISYPYFKTGYASHKDFFDLPIKYIKYLFLKKSKRLYSKQFIDFASPPFYGNYINMYAQKS